MISYLPIVRPKTAERKLMNRYGLGLDGFQDNSSVPFKPIIEVVDQDINIEGWQGQFEQSLEYLKIPNHRIWATRR